MADYRQVHTKMWTDEWFLELEPEAKLLWIYLFSNKRACLSGLYDIPMRVMAFEAGLPHDTIEAHLQRFATAGKAFYEDGWILMPKLMRYNAHNITSPKIQGNLKNDVFAAPNIPLKRRWLDEYNALIPSDKATYRMTEADIGYIALSDIPVDTVDDKVLDTLSDTLYLEQNNTLQEQNSKGADAPISFGDWLRALQKPKSVGESNGVAVLVRMGQTLYEHFPPSETATYSRVGKLVHKAGSQAKLARIFWDNASKPLSIPLDYLTTVVYGKPGNGAPKGRSGEPVQRDPEQQRQHDELTALIKRQTGGDP